VQENDARHWAMMENKQESATRQKLAEPHVYSPPKQSSSPWRANKGKNRQRGMFARHQLATNSPWRVTKEKK